MGYDSFFKKAWERGKKIDPLTHKAIETVVKQDSKNVSRMARFAAKNTGGWLSERFTDLGDEADKNVDDPARGVGRAAATAGIIYGAGAAMGAAGGAGGAGGAGTISGGSGLAAGGGGASGAGLAATAGGSGYGLVAAGSGGGAGISATTAGSSGYGLTAGSGSAAAGSSTGGWQRWGRMASNVGQNMQQPEPEPLRQEDVDLDEVDLAAEYAVSSKRLKRRTARMSDAIERGASGGHPVDQNGVHIAAIQALTERIAKAKTKLEQLKGRTK